MYSLSLSLSFSRLLLYFEYWGGAFLIRLLLSLLFFFVFFFVFFLLKKSVNVIVIAREIYQHSLNRIPSRVISSAIKKYMTKNSRRRRRGFVADALMRALHSK